MLDISLLFDLEVKLIYLPWIVVNNVWSSKYDIADNQSNFSNLYD